MAHTGCPAGETVRRRHDAPPTEGGAHDCTPTQTCAGAGEGGTHGLWVVEKGRAQADLELRVPALDQPHSTVQSPEGACAYASHTVQYRTARERAVSDLHDVGVPAPAPTTQYSKCTDS